MITKGGIQMKTYKAEALKLPYGWTSFITTWVNNDKIKSECTEILTATKSEALRYAKNQILLREYWNGSITAQLKKKKISS